MKLTKGKISKLYKVKKQSLKRKNKKNKKSKHRTFRKHKKLNLARKTLKKYRGGADESTEVQIVDKPFNSRSGTITNTNYVVDPDGKLKLASTPNPTGAPDAKPKGSIFGSKTITNTGKPSNNTNTSIGPNIEQPKQLTPRETAVMVIDQLYKEIHSSDQQNSSEALKNFVNIMAKPTPTLENGETSQASEASESKPPVNTNVPLLH
jgi:hypothetical protein